MTPNIRNATIRDVTNLRTSWRSFVHDRLRLRCVRPVRMINNGYLHTLNASFDGLFLREQKSPSLLMANHPMAFGAIQPCIRTDDKLSARHSLLHLGLFEIYGTSVLRTQSATPASLAEETIPEFFTFYSDCLHLDPSMLRVYYFGGGTLRSISHGVIRSDEYIPADQFSVDLWTSLGLSSNQLIPEFSNETFLLHLAHPLREHHSGYRNDIFIALNRHPAFEIATLNFISHRTVLTNEGIIGILPLSFSLREIALGQERIVASLTHNSNLYELPSVDPLVQLAFAKLGNQQDAMVYADALMVLHYLFSDGWTRDKLVGTRFREHRHQVNRLLDTVWRLGGEALRSDDWSSELTLNSKLHPWYPSLVPGVQITVNEIEYYHSYHT